MNLKSFLKVVEIQTKIASVTPFLLGISYTLYRFGSLKAMSVLLFFLSMLAFDMFTTTLNNYMDWKRAQVKSGYNYETHNAIVRDNLSERTLWITMASLFLFAAVLGLITFLSSDLTVLVLGGASFLIGILYSAGPLPISRTPLGELFSGFFMGLVIPFLVIYLSIYDKHPIGVALDASNLFITINWSLLLPIILITLPPMFCIAGIMLANNICDVEDDLPNNRYTLPICIGRKKALIIYDALYIFSFIDILACVILGYLPLISIVTLLSAIKVYQNQKAFHALQTKKDTFGLSVLNLVLIVAPLIVSLFIGFIITLF